MLGFDRSDVGASLLSSWSLPDVVHQGVGYLHDPEELPDAGREEAAHAAQNAVRGRPMPPDSMKKLANRIAERHAAIGYEAYQPWIAKHPPG